MLLLYMLCEEKTSPKVPHQGKNHSVWFLCEYYSGANLYDSFFILREDFCSSLSRAPFFISEMSTCAMYLCIYFHLLDETNNKYVVLSQYHHLDFKKQTK
jgi:hypothetical protein